MDNENKPQAKTLGNYRQKNFTEATATAGQVELNKLYTLIS
jgi:hypothetical protein